MGSSASQTPKVRKAESARMSEEKDVEREVEEKSEGENPAGCGTHKRKREEGGRLPP